MMFDQEEQKIILPCGHNSGCSTNCNHTWCSFMDDSYICGTCYSSFHFYNWEIFESGRFKWIGHEIEKKQIHERHPDWSFE
jgi:hypothetical protein